MKIAIDCRMSGMGGVGAYLDNILFYLINNFTENYYLLIGNESRLRRYQNQAHCTILPTDIPIFSPKEFFGFPTKEINVCDVFYSPSYNIPAGIKIPIFSTIHDLVFLDVDGLTSQIGKLIRWMTVWRSIKISKKIFTVSKFTKERILHHFNTRKDIIVAYNSIRADFNVFVASAASPFNFPYILFIGNIKKNKGISRLIDAYNKALADGYQQKLVIVGNAENFKTSDNEIINLIDSSNQNNNIVFTGKITDEQLKNTIAHATLLVQPSIYEGFGIPPLEALYLGCKAIISDIPVFHEIYDNLPVTFFDVEDTEDLKNKIISCSLESKAMIGIRNKINALYSLERTIKLILSGIENR